MRVEIFIKGKGYFDKGRERQAKKEKQDHLKRKLQYVKKKIFCQYCTTYSKKL